MTSHKMIFYIFVVAIIVSIQAQPASCKTAERAQFGCAFKVTQLASNPTKLRIQGDIGPCPSYITPRMKVFLGKLESKVANEQLVLTVNYTTASEKQVFDHIVEVPSSVHRVAFGSERKQIWPVDTFYSEEERKACLAAVEQFQLDYPNVNVQNYFVGIVSAPTEELRRRDASVFYVGFQKISLPTETSFLTYSVKKDSLAAVCIERMGAAISSEKKH